MRIICEYFLLSMFATILVLYFINPNPKIIIKYPSISDDVSDVYVDDQNVCYKYHKVEVN